MNSLYECSFKMFRLSNLQFSSSIRSNPQHLNKSPFVQSRRWCTTQIQQNSQVKQELSTSTNDKFLIPLGQLPKLEELGFAVVHVGGTQYKLMTGDVIMAQKIEGVPVGTEIMLSKVLLIGTKTWTAIGAPILEKARVHAVVEEQTRTEKAIVFKKKRRKNYVRHNSHRQPYTLLRVKDIFFDLKDYIDTSKGLSKQEILQNITTHPIPPIQRVPGQIPILSATAVPPSKIPYPSTANPPPHWDKKLLEKKAIKQAKDEKKKQAKELNETNLSEQKKEGKEKNVDTVQQ